jgi:transposase
MKQTRRKFDAKFKTKVALEAIQERETLNALAVKYGLSPVQISRWKKEFLDNASAAFETPKVDDEAIEKEKDDLLRKIGDLEMQLDFAKRVSKKLGIEIPAKH